MSSTLSKTIATPADFAPQAEEVQLPSQLGTESCVLLQRPDVIALIGGDGEAPDVLSNLVLSSLNGKAQAEKKGLEINRETLPQMLSTMRLIAKATFVQPKLWEKEESDQEHMPVKWLDFNDLSFVFAWALGAEYQPASSFPEKPGGGVEAVQPLPGLQGKAKPGGRDKK